MPHAVQYSQFGPPEVLTFVEVPERTPGPGQVLLGTRAIGVNPGEAKRRAGRRWPKPPTLPLIPGSDASGVVLAVGDGVEEFRPGDEVIGRGLSGSYAEQVLATPGQLLPKPAGLSFEAATLFGSPTATAYQVLRSLEVGEGDTLLVHGGAGGVGQQAVQFARAFGARVLATARPARHDRLRALGAVPVEYGSIEGGPGLADRVRAAAPEGVTVAFDTAGTDEALEVSLELVKDPDRIVTVGAVDDAPRWGVRSYSGNDLGPVEAALRREAARFALELWQRGGLDLEVGTRYPLREAAAAHRHSESRRVDGKIVLVP